MVRNLMILMTLIAFATLLVHFAKHVSAAEWAVLREWKEAVLLGLLACILVGSAYSAGLFPAASATQCSRDGFRTHMPEVGPKKTVNRS